MKLTTTKKLAQILNDKIKDFTIYQKSLTPQQFSWYVDINPHEKDYHYKTNTYSTLVIEYPYDYYACNQYATTDDLEDIWKHCDKTLDGFIQAFRENYLI